MHINRHRYTCRYTYILFSCIEWCARLPGIAIEKKNNELPSLLFALKICHKQYSRTAIIYIWSNDQNKQCRRIKDQNKRHVISIISVGRILSPISNTCKSLKSGTHVLIKTTTTKNDKNIPFYFYGHWLKKSINGWNIQLILILKSWKIYSPCPQDRFTSKYCIYTLVCIRNEGFFLPFNHSLLFSSAKAGLWIAPPSPWSFSIEWWGTSGVSSWILYSPLSLRFCILSLWKIRFIWKLHE